MLVGQNLGPFAIDKELGSGAMGTVYRATYTRTGQRVAIKIMVPGLVANEAAIARFEREANILKQLSHPNITRLFGVGKTQGMRYYAMEYVEGESMDKILNRRSKFGWEEVIPWMVQLCDALQHAHDRGVVHRDLKPSNLMVLKDGTLKLTDFGIAKDLDVTALTGANCTVGTAAYMSPEQCRGDRDLTFKSDLYSLGVVIYELLTGQKPFQADNAMDMFLCHVQAMPDRPSRRDLSIPIWLDTLILQLMEKNVEDRPRDASAVAESLERIREKVEASQSAGEDAVKMRKMDRHSENRNEKLAEEDREAARALKGKTKGKGKGKKPTGPPVYQRGWFVALAVLGVLVGFGTLLWLLFRPPSAETLYEKAQTLMRSDKPEDWHAAVDGPIKEYIAQYPGRPGRETEQMRKWLRDMDIYGAEQLLQSYLKKKNSAISFQHQNDAEKLAFKAADAERAGNLEAAAKIWMEIKKDFSEGSGLSRWGFLADSRLAQFAEINAMEQKWQTYFANITRLNLEPSGLSSEEEAAFTAERLLRFGDPFLAKKRYQELRDKLDEDVARKPILRKYQLLSARKAYELRDAQDTDRKKLLDDRLAELQSRFDKGTAMTLVTLYKDDLALRPQVEAARALIRMAEMQ